MFTHLLSLPFARQLRFLFVAALLLSGVAPSMAQAPDLAASVIGLGTATQVVTEGNPFFPPGAAVGDQGLVFFSATETFPMTDQARVTAPPVRISGVTPGQKLVGIDSRPLNGLLYGLGYDGSKTTANAQLYTVDTATGAVTPVGAATTLALGTVGPLGQNIGFDFNPVADRIRVVSSNRANYRLDPRDGSVVLKDGDLAYTTGTLTPGVTTAAYTNSTIGSTSTTLYNVDKQNGSILTIQSLPNNGTLIRTQPRLLLRR